MEVPVIVFGAIAFTLIIAVMVYLITWCSTKEADFDEVLRERKRMEDAIASKPKKTAVKKDKVKKVSKTSKKNNGTAKKNKVVKEKAPARKDVTETLEHSSADEETVDERKMVQLELDPEVINDETMNITDLQMSASLRNRKKGNKLQPQKSILHNKHEMPLVKEVSFQ